MPSGKINAGLLDNAMNDRKPYVNRLFGMPSGYVGSGIVKNQYNAPITGNTYYHAETPVGKPAGMEKANDPYNPNSGMAQKHLAGLLGRQVLGNVNVRTQNPNPQ